MYRPPKVSNECTVYPKKYAHGFCLAVLCCGYTLTDFPISIRLTSLALWQSNDCPSASKATLMNMDKYFMWIHYERLHNHNKAKHNKTVCIFIGIHCTWEVLSRLTDYFVGNSNLTVLFGDINYDMCKDNILYDLCDIYDLKNSIDGPACFKGETTPTLLDVFLTNKPNSFCHFLNVDTGISDLHNLTGAVSKVHAPQSNKRLTTYRSMKHFDQEEFTKDLANVPFHICEIFDDINDTVWAQQHLLSSIIDIHAPLKQRFLRKNQVPYMNPQLRKAIHQRNMWRNKHFKDKRDSIARNKYVHYRNKVVKLTKSSVNAYFLKQCEGHGNNKQFFKTVKPFLGNKSNGGSGNKIILNENDRIVTNASEVVGIFNTFYGSIADYPDGLYDGLDHISLVDVMTKHCLHERIVNIKSHMGARVSNFDFHDVSVDDILKKIKCLKSGKSPGYDGIQATFFKMADANFASSLRTLLTNVSQHVFSPQV